jgi:hypothetical protein
MPRYKRRGRKPARKHTDVHTIESFCQANGISVGYYFKLKKAGLHPREMKVGKRVFITPEAEADWRRAREADAATAQKEGNSREHAQVVIGKVCADLASK